MSSQASASFPHSLPAISGYTIVEQLYLGSRTGVYRAIHNSQQRSVVVKVLRREYPSFSELIQFRNQYTITKNLSISGTVQPLGLEPLGSGYALIMEDWGGIALGQYLQKQSLALGQILEIALQLADVLHDLCHNRVVHKDIKPANILIHPETKQVKLIDFSIASLLLKETQEIQNPNILEGSLAYLAPEQTGRMNRGIDYRADFYALGVTLYQLLSGKLPFESDDPLALVHCHLAKVPTPIDQVNPAVPGMVAEIVSKLMAKNAEDRYQSAMGLKYDLQQCLSQWQAAGAITDFQLGQRDLSDRFLIPEKLYGREAEVQTILETFDRVAQGRSELMLVAGFSGIGKTAVINEVHKPITRQNGYFVKGKFDQFNRNVPLSAFVQALRDFMGQLLSESDAQLAQWKTEILAALGDNGQVLIEVIPELEQIIGQQSSAPELSETATQNRFSLLFQKFIQVFTTANHPLVLFLDDLQWADSASLQLVKLLMNGNGYLLMLGAYRDNEVSPAHPFILMLEELEKAEVTLHTITLKPLAAQYINHLIADTLHCSEELTQPLTQLVNRKTQGNPFFTTQFLRALHAEGYITLNGEHRYWECDIAQVNALALTDDVVEFVTLQLQRLPDKTQQVLKLAACVGHQFDLATLAIILEEPHAAAAAALWEALQQGLILPTNQSYKFFQDIQQTGTQLSETQSDVNPTYCFLHDRVQQAAYNLIPENQKQETHLTIGRLLLKDTVRAESNLFKIVNHWNIAIDLIDRSTERGQLAQLNYLAGHKAAAATAYEPALRYYKTGLSLLETHCWETQYSLSLKLHEGAAKAAFIHGDYSQMGQWSSIVLQRGRTILDKVKIYDVQVQAQMAQAKPTVAIQIALEALKLLDIILPDAPSPIDIENELQKTKALWENRDIASLAELPSVRLPEKKAAIIILSSIFAPSFIAKPSILPLIACQQIQLSIQFGNCEHSAFGYANYSAILSTLCHDLDASYQFGQLSIHLVEKLNAKEVRARTFNQAAIFSLHGKVHLQAAPPILQQGCQSGIENGDLEFAGYAAYNWSQYSYFSGLNLTHLQQRAKTYGLLLSQINQRISLSCNQLVQQVAINLLGESDDPHSLSGSVFDEKKVLEYFLENQVFSGVQYLFLHKIALSYLLEDFEQILEYVDWSERYLYASTGMITVPTFYFYAALARLQVYTTATSKKEQLWIQVNQNCTALREWAEQAPVNFQHKLELVTAEQHRVLGEMLQAADFYDRAIAGAKSNGYIQEEALANELAAKFYLAWDKERISQDYLTDAYYGYARWDAKAKVRDLERRYPRLLAPILQQNNRTLSATETVFATESLTGSKTYEAHSTTSASHSISATLDLTTILKASQTLSSEIQLDRLLTTLLRIVLENAGADKCVLLMPREQEWFVKAVAMINQPTKIQSVTLSNSSEIPHSLINSVRRNLQPIVIINALTHSTLATEGYVVEHQPKSMLCTPILQQGKLVAILYLENRLTIGAFTSDRITLLNLLCAQAAISLENAQLYQQAQAYAQDLEQSQLQIVHNEKMASLGNLIAGVAHEINNPVGFLKGSINNGKDYVQAMFAHLALYQQHYPDPVAAIQDHAEDIDLEFLGEDLPKLLNSMEGASDRIQSISTSLRTFSRADTEHRVSANLHEGIDSTLLILKYRLKANQFRPTIQVIQNYGELPSIDCFPGQLNQVFMNILANAIDMFDDMAQSQSFAQLKANPQQITIRTAIDENQVRIWIRDNGKGMTQELKARIFDHLFTTKGVGKGTGLGLAIARQIVVEKHGGSLEVHSELGQWSEFCICLPNCAESDCAESDSRRRMPSPVG